MKRRFSLIMTLAAGLITITGCTTSTTQTPQSSVLPHTFTLTPAESLSTGLPAVGFSIEYGDIDTEKSALPNTAGGNYADFVMNNAEGQFMEELAIGYFNQGAMGAVPSDETQALLLDQFKTQLENGYTHITFETTGKKNFLNQSLHVLEARISIDDENEGPIGEYLLMMVLYPNPDGANGVTFILQSELSASEIQDFDDFDNTEVGTIGTMLSTFEFIK